MIARRAWPRAKRSAIRNSELFALNLSRQAKGSAADKELEAELHQMMRESGHAVHDEDDLDAELAALEDDDIPEARSLVSQSSSHCIADEVIACTVMPFVTCAALPRSLRLSRAAWPSSRCVRRTISPGLSHIAEQGSCPVSIRSSGISACQITGGGAALRPVHALMFRQPIIRAFKLLKQGTDCDIADLPELPKDKPASTGPGALFDAHLARHHTQQPRRWRQRRRRLGFVLCALESRCVQSAAPVVAVPGGV